MAKLEGVKVIDMTGGEVTKIAYEGAEYVKLADKTKNKKGDIALVVDGWGNQKTGEYYWLINEDHPFWENDAERFVYINGKKVDASCSVDDAEIFRKVNPETPTLDLRVTKLEQDVAELQKAENDEVGEAETAEQPTYEKGDKIRVVAAEDTDEEYEDGDILTVKGYAYTGRLIYVQEHKRGLYPREVEPATPKVGDKVRVVNAVMSAGHYANGDVLTIRLVDNDGDISVEEHDLCLYPREVELMTTAEVKAWEKEKAEQQAQRLVVGDYAKIGRKKNEYKPGDIAEVVNSPNASPKGTLVTVTDVDSTAIYAVGWSSVLRRNIVFRYDRTDLKLVTPVERRFDKQ